VFGDEAAACSEVEDKMMMHSKFEDEAAKCFRAGVEEGKLWQCGGVRGDRRASSWRFQKISRHCVCERESAGPEILGHRHPMRDTLLLRASPFS
jgi:hypothetical protein